MKNSGRVFVVSAPSGGGKTTIVGEVMRRHKELVRSVSMTTRSPRPGETDGKDYLFVSKSQFVRTLKKRGFLEHAKVFDHYYGTPKAYVDGCLKKGRDVLLVIDVQGGRQVKKRLPGAVLVFILPPSLKELGRRLKKRAQDSAEVIKRRLREAQKEIYQSRYYDYVIKNENVGQSADALETIVLAERMRVRR